jgi:hypothetical protein
MWGNKMKKLFMVGALIAQSIVGDDVFAEITYMSGWLCMSGNCDNEQLANALRQVPFNLNFEGRVVVNGGAFGKCRFCDIGREKEVLQVTIAGDIRQLSGLFKDCVNLRVVCLPESANILWLPDNFFEGCTSLRSIEIPASMRAISKACFKGCTSLCDVIFAYCCGVSVSVVESLGAESFGGCTSLQAIIIPRVVKQIEDGCFKGCISLRNVKFASYSTTIRISDNAFLDCHLDGKLMKPVDYHYNRYKIKQELELTDF